MTRDAAAASFRSPARPRALVENFRASLVEEPVSRPAPQPRRQQNFPRLSAGQVLRTVLLAAVCLGFAQISHVDRARAEKQAVDAENTVAR